MTAPTFPLTAETVRAFMGVAVDSTAKYTNDTIGSNIRTAVDILERRTHRFLGDRTATMSYTTQGKPLVTIHGLRTASSVSLAGASMTVNAGYWLVPDSQQTGLYTGVQLRGFSNRQDGPWRLASPNWFDTNMDSPYHPGNRGGGLSSLPNDLVIAGDWGFDSGATTDVPDGCLMAVKALAAHLTDLGRGTSDGYSTPEGSFVDLGTYPDVVQDFIREWSISPGVGS